MVSYIDLMRTNFAFVSYSGNSAVQAISLLIRKGVPESNIIFLNLISVSNFGYLIVCFGSFWGVSYSICDFPFLMTVLPGTTRCAYGMQKLPKNKDSDIWDWHWSEQRFPSGTWHGWIWRPIFWHRWRWPTSGDHSAESLTIAADSSFYPPITFQLLVHKNIGTGLVLA